MPEDKIKEVDMNMEDEERHGHGDHGSRGEHGPHGHGPHGDHGPKPEGIPPHILKELFDLKEKVGRLEGMMEVMLKKM